MRKRGGDSRGAEASFALLSTFSLRERDANFRVTKKKNGREHGIAAVSARARRQITLPSTKKYIRKEQGKCLEAGKEATSKGITL